MNIVTYLDWLQEQCGLDHIIKFTESKDNNFFVTIGIHIIKDVLKYLI